MFEYVDKKIKTRKRSQAEMQTQNKEANVLKNAKCIMLKSDRGIVQRQPIPYVAGMDGIGDLFHDDIARGIVFTKIGEDRYLYDEEKILKWSQGQYLDSSGARVDISNLSPAANHTVVVAMGEMGEITNNSYKIMTSYASPCLILIIKNSNSIKMAHIFSENTDESIGAIIESLTPNDEITLATEVDSDEDDTETEEYAIQRERRIALDATFTEMKTQEKIASYVYNENMQNATASFTGPVIKHKDNTDPKDLRKLALVRTNQMDESTSEHKVPIIIRPKNSNVQFDDNHRDEYYFDDDE